MRNSDRIALGTLVVTLAAALPLASEIVQELPEMTQVLGFALALPFGH
jgi:ABC-type spermidine/putrescine transport system permease subunit I